MLQMLPLYIFYHIDHLQKTANQLQISFDEKRVRLYGQRRKIPNNFNFQ